MAGKLRVAHAPWVNHGWHATLHVRPRGLAIESIAYGGGSFTLLFDLTEHCLRLTTSEGVGDGIALGPGSIADAHRDLVAMLDRHGLPSRFHGVPNEVEDAMPFAKDAATRDYDRGSAERLHRALLSADAIFRQFRAGFAGKASPVHFFWGSFDLAVTRFSGRPAPPHPGGLPGLPDRITREAYSQEVSSAGLWLGGVVPVAPLFYSYAYPDPPGFRDAKIAPAEARFDSELGEFVLDYEAVRTSRDPAAALMQFLESSYAAAADLAGWDRSAIERAPVAP